MGGKPVSLLVNENIFGGMNMMFDEGIYNTTLFKQVYPANNGANQVRIYERR